MTDLDEIDVAVFTLSVEAYDNLQQIKMMREQFDAARVRYSEIRNEPWWRRTPCTRREQLVLDVKMAALHAETNRLVRRCRDIVGEMNDHRSTLLRLAKHMREQGSAPS